MKPLPLPDVDTDLFECEHKPYLDENPAIAEQQRKLLLANMDLGLWHQRLLLAQAYDNAGNFLFDWRDWQRNVRHALELCNFEGTMSEWIEYARTLDYKLPLDADRHLSHKQLSRENPNESRNIPFAIQ
jgi:hypothetical protein